MLQMGAATKIDKEYSLKCEVRSLEKYYEDEDKNGKKFRASTTMYFLVPKSSTHQVLFYDAWLPSYELEHPEVVGVVETPINKVGRFAISRANKECQDHHLICMSVDVEDEISKYVKWCKKNQTGSDYPELIINIQPAKHEDKFNV